MGEETLYAAQALFIGGVSVTGGGGQVGVARHLALDVLGRACLQRVGDVRVPQEVQAGTPQLRGGGSEIGAGQAGRALLEKGFNWSYQVAAVMPASGSTSARAAGELGARSWTSTAWPRI